MSYLLATAGAFWAFALIQPRHYGVWLILAALAAVEGLNAQLNAGNWVTLQAVRGSAVFAAGYALCYIKSTFSLYQAGVLLFTLVAYLALAVDVYAFRQPVLIAHDFKGIIHGLVVAQFVGFFGPLLINIFARSAGRNFNFKNIRELPQ